jgi:hypothetical protein
MYKVFIKKQLHNAKDNHIIRHSELPSHTGYFLHIRQKKGRLMEV